MNADGPGIDAAATTSNADACVCCLPRRRFLAQAGALSTMGALAALDSFAQTPAAKSYRIDIHHHILPLVYMQAIATRRGGPVPDWSAARSLDEMDQSAIATTMLSIVQPGVWLGKDEEGRRLARECNEFGAGLVRDHPRRFGIFAALPLGDVPGSLSELTYALDTLKADGIGLMTSFGDKWLGDPAFWPVRPITPEPLQHCYRSSRRRRCYSARTIHFASRPRKLGRLVLTSFRQAICGRSSATTHCGCYRELPSDGSVAKATALRGGLAGRGPA